MAEPSRRASRLSIAGALLAALGIGAAGFVVGRGSVEPASKHSKPPPVTPSSAPTPEPALPAIQPPLGRAELIAAASSAADTFGGERPLPEEQAELAGRSFELRLPFGCPGALLPSEALSAEYDKTAEALRVRAEPVRWPPEAWLPNSQDPSEGAAVVEAIEGFWISRPWTSSEACPASIGATSPQGSAEQTLAIAQFFTSDGSRVGRRDGKAYEAVENAAPEAVDMSRGFHLRLRGKVARTPGGGGPILCRAPTGMRPVCVVSVKFDEVAIENVATRATLATWDVSSQTRESATR